MKCMKKLVLGAMLTATVGLAGLAPAKAVTFDFQTPPAAGGSSSQTWTIGGIPLTATGYTSYNTTTFAIDGSPTNIITKSAGSDENGLGLTNDPSGQNEITGLNLIRISLPTGLSSISFTMGSSTAGESWSVYGSTSALTGYSFLLGGTDEGVSHALTTADDFFYFVANGGGANNVLLSTVSAVSAVPLPGALPLFATGLGLMGFLGLRKRRKAPAAVA